MREPATRTITCAADAVGLDFLVIDDFLRPHECNHLASIYRASEGEYETWHTEPFWKGRLLGYRDVKDRAAVATVMGVLSRAQCEVQDFYEHYPQRPLYPDVLHVVGWPTGWEMPTHADNAHESGEPHALAWRDYSGVLYLNDDFEGGGLYLPKQDILIQPRRGMFVSLPCGLSHMHGVTKVTSGLRITLAFFLTTEIAHADRRLLEEIAA